MSRPTKAKQARMVGAGIVKRDVKTKFGLVFAKGERVAWQGVHYPECGPYTHLPFVMVRSTRSGLNTSIPLSAVTVDP